MMWRGGINAEMLAELRAIRQEIHELAERVGNAATREELDAYLPKETFDTYVRERERGSWRQNLPLWCSAFAVLWAVVGPYIHFGK